MKEIDTGLTGLVIVSAESGDWEGLYRNGILLTQGHSLRIWEVLKLLGFCVEERVADDEWIENNGSLPESLDWVEYKK